MADRTVVYDLNAIVLLEDLDIQTPNGTDLTINGVPIGFGGGGGGIASVNGDTGPVVVLTADEILPSQTGNEGRFYTTDGTTSSWGVIPASGTVVVNQDYTDPSTARPVGAEIVYWFAVNTELPPTNAIAADRVFYSQDFVATVYTHNGSTYALAGGRIFIGPEDPASDGYTLAAGDQWLDNS
jgi:hypothetical protein